MREREPRRLWSSAAIALVILCTIASIILFGRCSKRGRGEPSVLRGKKIFNSSCLIGCHHPDPTKERGTGGMHGPPIAGSSFELLKLRVLSAKYPEGYKPKRNTKNMTTFRLTDDDLRSLELFLKGGSGEGTGK